MRLGLTIGVWDVWHPGHTHVLTRCRECCDYLFVGIMTDFWCHVQKGHDRPFESLQKRRESLQRSGLADRIVVVDTLEIHHYLQMVDVWFKGEDQKNMRPLDYPCTTIIPRLGGVSSSTNGRPLKETS
jgi:cytidyltransferase-like protein